MLFATAGITVPARAPETASTGLDLSFLKPASARRGSGRPLTVGDVITDSPVGPGTVTSFTSRGVPRVREVAVTWLQRDDGFVLNPTARRR